MNKKAIIVFGGAGFIGTKLVDIIHEQGTYDIISVDIIPPRKTLDNVEYRIHDVRDLTTFEAPNNVERIYNFAAVHTTPGHPDHEYYDTNVNGALQITLLAERLGVEEIIFTSSISIYGPSEEMKTEASTPNPESAYGRSKLMAEKIHNQWVERAESRRLTTVRPAVVFGPGEGGNFTRLAKLLKKGFFIYPGRKDTIKACVYVDDLVDAIEYAHGLGEKSVLFNGAYPQRFTLEDVVETFKNAYFPNTKTYLVPKQVVLGAASGLKVADFVNLGIHPDRVMKLVRSTNVYSNWLHDQGKEYPDALGSAFKRWSDATNGAFD